jgi:hypothetical protein
MTGITSKRAKLETQLRNTETQLAHKQIVMGKHAPGTAHYTRAYREAESIRGHIVALRERIAQC